MPVQELWIEGYRSVQSLRFPLEPVTVVVGPNGCGKTNVYRALQLLHSGAEGSLAHSLAEEGGMPSVLWAGSRKKGEPARFTVGVRLEDLAYELSCGLVPPPEGPFGLDPDVKEETVWLHEGKRRHVMAERRSRSVFARDAEGHRTTFAVELWGNESVLAQIVEPHRFPLLSALRAELLRWRFYHHFRTDPESPLRHAQVGVRTPALAHDGRDLAAALMTIDNIGDDRGLHEAVENAFPGSSLELDNEDGRFSIRMRMPGLQRALEASELSDGTLRYLCLLAALLSPRPPPFLALNEPETSLHPSLLEPLGRLIATASRRSQVFVTTHAHELATALEKHAGASVLSLRKDGGATELVE
ncbi:AAA family ATPase [Vitiosangium sp. GDMCC 1.1324]|uniref:AAA family ATPase n=1 Tax=Vitiosangium sp. (strain GDMCC 1.1324) TaxID=2138576 RepID=UPI000D3D7394|nr:AAA family ATPase [Vitiosangium sp. GDMCC 1.1324]PTL83860.1 recombinase RecF [Vitiosangium sp. GDMCC 1.1324]